MENIKDIHSKIDKSLEEIERLIPPDIIEQATGAKVGSEEYIEQNKLINSVKATNSTRRVNITLASFRIISYIGIIGAFILKIIGIHYDINYHMPFIEDKIGELGAYIIALILTIIIMTFTHSFGDGLVNNKWKRIPRVILMVFLLFGLSASIYFDYRAISNFTNSIVEDVKVSKMMSKTSINGIKISAINNELDSLNNKLELYKQDLNSVKTRLNKISEERSTINGDINRVKIKKEQSGISKKEIRKLNQNIYTSRKQLDALSNEEEKLINRQNNILQLISETENQIKNKTEEKITVVGTLDNNMGNEKTNRFIFMFIFILLIEFVSYLGLLADFMGTKNLDTELKNKIDALNNDINMKDVLFNNLSIRQAQQAQNTNRELQVSNAVSQIYALSNINNMYHQGENIKALINATNTIAKNTSEIADIAIDGMSSNISFQIEKRKNDKLLELLQNEKI